MDVWLDEADVFDDDAVLFARGAINGHFGLTDAEGFGRRKPGGRADFESLKAAGAGEDGDAGFFQFHRDSQGLRAGFFNADLQEVIDLRVAKPKKSKDEDGEDDEDADEPFHGSASLEEAARGSKKSLGEEPRDFSRLTHSGKTAARTSPRRSPVRWR